MARRRTTTVRRSKGANSQAGTALAGLIIALITAIVTVLVWIITTSTRLFLARWRVAGPHERKFMAGGLGGLVLLCVGIGIFSPPTQSRTTLTTPARSFAAAGPLATSTTTMPPASPTAQPSPTQTTQPTLAPSLTPTLAPPLGQITKGGNMRSEPRVDPQTLVAKLCAGDAVAFLSQQNIDDALWYHVQVMQTGADCVAGHAQIGSEGWVSSTLLSEPSYALSDYARAQGFRLPTAIVFRRRPHAQHAWLLLSPLKRPQRQLFQAAHVSVQFVVMVRVHQLPDEAHVRITVV